MSTQFVTEDMMELLKNIDSKLGEIIPRVTNIERRLDKIELYLSSDPSLNKSGQNTNSVPSCDTISDISDSISISSGQSDRDLVIESEVFQSAPAKLRYGLIMSDSDMSEEAQHIGQLLDCQVDMYNYSAGNVEPSLFNTDLEFVVIQDSGKVLDRYAELTTDTVRQMTGHVQHLVKLANSILGLQPNTRVFLGSLPPRCDVGLRRDLTRVFNGLLVTESFLEDRISVIDQSQLHSRDERKMYERFEVDLSRLTKYGKKLRNKNTASQIVRVVPGFFLVRKKKPTNHHPPVNKARYGGCKKKNENIRSYLVKMLQNL